MYAYAYMYMCMYMCEPFAFGYYCTCICECLQTNSHVCFTILETLVARDHARHYFDDGQGGHGRRSLSFASLLLLRSTVTKALLMSSLLSGAHFCNDCKLRTIRKYGVNPRWATCSPFHINHLGRTLSFSLSGQLLLHWTLHCCFARFSKMLRIAIFMRVLTFERW